MKKPPVTGMAAGGFFMGCFIESTAFVLYYNLA